MKKCERDSTHEVDDYGCIDCFYEAMQKKQFELWDKLD